MCLQPSPANPSLFLCWLCRSELIQYEKARKPFLGLSLCFYEACYYFILQNKWYVQARKLQSCRVKSWRQSIYLKDCKVDASIFLWFEHGLYPRVAIAPRSEYKDTSRDQHCGINGLNLYLQGESLIGSCSSSGSGWQPKHLGPCCSWARQDKAPLALT